MPPRERSSRDQPGGYVELQKFEELVPIDKYNLDTLLQEHPDLFYRVSVAYEEAGASADQAKSYMDRLGAELDVEYRERMLKDGGKATDTAVKQAVANDPDMKAASEEFLDKRRLLGRWRALKDAYETRFKSMKELVQLYSSGYFSDAVGNKARRVERDMRVEEAAAARTKALAERPIDPTSSRRSRSE